MPIEDIERKIIEDAEKKASLIREEGNKQKNQLLMEVEEKIKAARENILKEAEKVAKEKREGIIAQARLRSKDRILRKKGELINELFSQALSDFASIDDNEYQKIIEVMLNKLSKWEGRIIPVTNRRQIAEKALSAVKFQKLSSDQSFDLILSPENIEASGGFILKTKQFNLDWTFEAFLKEIREEMELEITKELFSG